MGQAAYDVLVRPAIEDDLEALAAITSIAFHEVDLATLPRSLPTPEPRSPERNARWIRRTRQALQTDPGGCWVAEVDGVVVGGAISRVRELMWTLASFAVLPGHQGRGVGTQLLAAAAQHGRGCLRAMLAASADPAAVRRYRLAGFDLHPQMFATGVAHLDPAPDVSRVREGSAGDRDLLDSIDRRTRGAAHLADHDVLLSECRLLVCERSSGSAYAYADPAGSPVLVAGTSRRTASEALWAVIDSAPPGSTITVPHITSANQWALDVALAARLTVHQAGYLCVRGMKPPSPYLHHGSLL